MTSLTAGDWVTVKPDHDIPVIFRPGGQRTKGRIHRIDGDTAEVWVPIGGADVDEHSQSVPYPVDALEKVA